MLQNHVGTLLQQLNACGSNRSRSSAFSALPQGLSGGLGLPEFAMFSQLQGLAAFNNPQQSIFSPEGAAAADPAAAAAGPAAHAGLLLNSTWQPGAAAAAAPRSLQASWQLWLRQEQEWGLKDLLSSCQQAPGC